MTREFSNWANEKENKQWLTDFIDSIADRQMARLTGSMGGIQKGLNAENEILGPWGQFAPLIKLFLAQRNQNANNSSAQSGLSGNPFVKT